MNKFNIGDHVRVARDTYTHKFATGTIGIITCILDYWFDDGNMVYEVSSGNEQELIAECDLDYVH